MRTDTLVLVGVVAVVGYFVLFRKPVAPTSPVTGGRVTVTDGSANPWNQLAGAVGSLLGGYQQGTQPELLNTY
jgi:hypothetical protein